MNEFDFALDLKSLNDEGEISGLAVGYGNIDRGGDIVARGAISSSIAARKSIPMLLYHDQRRPVGSWTSFEEVSDGLLVKGKFSNTSPAREAREDAKCGALGGLSMGYNTLKHRMEGKARHLLEVDLHEISLVTIPMNDRTRVTSVKEIEDLRALVAAGDRLTERQMETLFKKSFGLSNAEAERAVRIHFVKGQGEPGATAEDPAAAFWAAMNSAA